MNLPSLRPLRYLTALLLLTGVAWAAPTGSSGSGTAIDVAQPTLALNWVICVSGVFPFRGEPADGTSENAIFSEIRCMAFNASMTGWLPCDGRIINISANTALYSLLGTNFGGDAHTTFALPDLRGRVPVGMENAAAIGQKGGQDQLTLTTSNLPAHAHTGPGGLTSSTGNGTAFDKQQPYLKLNVCVEAYGVYDSIGWVRIFACNFAPSGFFPCAGGTAATADFEFLFNKIGTSFGGNGTTTFGLPDLRGRSLLGIGTGTGLSPRSFGDSFGAATHTLTTNELAAHTHTLFTSNTGSVGNGAAFDKMQPYLGLNHGIATSGIYLGSSDSPALGEVRFFAAVNIPSSGYLPCDGRLVFKSGNSGLFSLLGTDFGGNGANNFALPDLRGRCAADLGDAGSGGGTRTIANQWGAETLTLQLANLPAHTHDYTLASVAPEPAGGGTQMHFHYVDAPSQSYIVQSTDSLSPADWQPRATNTTDGLGQLDFVDAPPLPPARFYRTVQP